MLIKRMGIGILSNESRIEKNLPEFLSREAVAHIRRFHTTITDYKATPLARLDGLAGHLGIKRIYVKDESKRFCLNAFKVLGGSYAVTKILCNKLGLNINTVTFSDFQTPEMREKLKDMVFITATDGNHGRGVAWTASQYGCKSYVYMTAQSRVDAIKIFGAEEVIVTDCNYDDTVRLAAQRAQENNWNLVQDTAWDGYEEIPGWITRGYTTLGAEILDQLKLDGIEKPTHLFLQAGVGSYAGGILGYFSNIFNGNPPIQQLLSRIMWPVSINLLWSEMGTLMP